jgi:large subunit ribosomal protein L30
MAGKTKSKKNQEKTVRITLVKSPIGYSERQKRTVRALGLRKLNQTVEQKDSESLRGMLASVNHLLVIEEQDPS